MSSHAKEIAAASDALKRGRFDEADRVLSGILKRDPKCAEAHHFRAILLTQQRNPIQAVVHAERAVALDPEKIPFRGNLGATLMMIGELEAALPHLDRALAAAPDYILARRNRGKLYAALERHDDAIGDLNAAVRLEPNRAETRLALANVLIDVGRFDEAAAALEAVRKREGTQSVSWRFAWGRLMFRLGRLAEAQEAFTATLLANPGTMNHYIALAATRFQGGELREAERITREAFKRFPASERAAGAPALRVLVLESYGQRHFHRLPAGSFNYRQGNFPTNMPVGRIAYTYVVSDMVDSIGDVMDLAPFDLACNNRVVHEIVEAEQQEAQLARIVDELPFAVINGPAAVAPTTRDGNARRFADAERFVFPRTIRVRHTLDPAPTKALILDTLKLPVILRPLITHVGVGASLARTERELEQEIAQRPFSDFFAIEFHDCRSDDDLFRRYRVGCVDGVLSANGLHVSDQWNVHGAERQKVGWDEGGFDREELAFLEDPAAVLGAEPADIFAEIVANTALDIYGIDFAFDRDGWPVVFEVNAAMALGLDIGVVEFPYRKPYVDRFVAAIEDLFFARSGRNDESAPD